MLSIVCKNMTLTNPNAARRDGVRFLGEKLQGKLAALAIAPAVCVRRALQAANGAHQAGEGIDPKYALFIEETAGTFLKIIQVTKLPGAEHKKKIYCTLETGDTISLSVHEDDDKDKDDRKMEIVIPGDRSRIIDPDTMYVLGVADDIDAIYTGPGTIAYPARNKAAHYTLASITFRRCA